MLELVFISALFFWGLFTLLIFGLLSLFLKIVPLQLPEPVGKAICVGGGLLLAVITLMWLEPISEGLKGWGAG